MRNLLSIAALCAAAVTIGACGTQAVSVPSGSQYYKGAVLFREHCSGCHSLAVVGAQGSAVGVSNRVRTNGPNFNFRKEKTNQVLYAIHNGGFSGAIMPENIVTGQEARKSPNSSLPTPASRRPRCLPRTSPRTSSSSRRRAAMLDLRLIREQPDTVRAALAAAGRTPYGHSTR